MSGTNGKDGKDADSGQGSKSKARDRVNEKTSLTSMVDLGDDLLEKTRTTSGDFGGAEEEPTRVWSDDQLQSARINLREGFVDEAKKILRKILIRDSRSLAAKQLLEEIQERELKQIFGGGAPQRPAPFKASDPSGAQSFELDASSVDPERVVQDLDRDYKLGLLLQDDLPAVGELSLFADRAAVERFAVDLDKSLAGATPQDRIDLAVGFLEMGVWDVAIRLLEAASRDNVDPDQRLSALSLLAVARMGAGKTFDAIQTIQVALHDAELRQEGKIDLIYLMGRAHERLGNRAESLSWYLQARELAPDHRDVAQRVERLEAGQGKGKSPTR